MAAVVDTSVLIDHLRDHAGATELLAVELAAGAVHASEVTRLEVLAGMRMGEEEETEALLSSLDWHPVDEPVAREAGALARLWRPSHSGIDAVDLAVAATTILLGARLLTLNVRHFPMFGDLRRPY